MKSKNRFSRRKFLSITGGFAIGSSVFLSEKFSIKKVLAQTVKLRPNIADLLPNSPQLNALQAGVDVMKKLPVNDFRNWRSQANIHNNYCPHGNWFFLPWHRAYLYFFEQICRQSSGFADFMLPYWDWTTSPRLPSSFWGNDNPLMNSTRQITPNSEASTEFVGQTVINNILSIKDFFIFASGFATEQRPNQPKKNGQLEGTPHNYIHGGFVGGDMSNFLSPLDPIFWLHHANIDRLWTQWVQLNPGRTTNDPIWLNFEVGTFFDLQGNAVKKKVSDILSTYSLGYRYSNQPEIPVNVQILGSIKENALSELTVKSNINKTTKVNESITVNVPKSSDSLKSSISKIVIAKPFEKSQLLTLRLTVELDKPINPKISVRIFINASETNVNTSIDDPSYVGTITFFESDHPMQGMSSSNGMNMNNQRIFLLDATLTIQKLFQSKKFKSLDEAKVSIIPVLVGSLSENIVSDIKLNSFKFEIL